MFEQAIRLKFRFPTPSGLATIEDLFDLPLTSTRGRANLNDVAKEIARQLKSETEEDFVNPSSGADKILQAKLEIVKHVIKTKQAENEAERTAADRKAQKARIMEIIAQKQEQEILGKPLDELTAMLAAL